MPTPLVELSGLDTVTVEVRGQSYELPPIGARHMALVERRFGKAITMEWLNSTDGVLALLTALFHDAGHVGLPDSATWEERESVVSRAIPRDELRQVLGRLAGGPDPKALAPASLESGAA